MNSSNEKVLLTGAGGFIGKEVICSLKTKKFDIYALTTADTQSTDGITFIKGNLLDYSTIQNIISEIKPEFLLHFAWPTTGYFNSNLHFDFLSISINMIKTFGENNGKRAVFAGTYLEYGHNDDNLNEFISPIEPIHIYGKCKNYLYESAKLYCQNNNISLGWGRIFSVFGKEVDKRRLTLDVISNLSENKEVVICSGSLLRDYIYNKDVADAFVTFLDSDVTGAVNICTGIETSVQDYVIQIAKKMGKEHLLIFKEQPSNQQRRVVGDNTRLTQEVGYQLKYDLSTALDEILE